MPLTPVFISAILVTCSLYVHAENAYGDHGIVFTAQAAIIDESYQNIVSVPSTPLEIDNTTEEYPGFNLGFAFTQPFSCDVDYSRNDLYVYDYYGQELLLLENYNSSAIRDAIDISPQHYALSPEYTHIAVDWVSHNVYWTDPLMNWIAMQPGGAINDNHRYKIILQKLNFPRGLAVDPIAGYLFWTDLARNSRIERSTLVGDKRMTLFASRLTQPDAVVADPFGERIYWIDLQYIDSATYEGTDRRHIVRDNNVDFYDVAIFKNVLIATDIYNLFSEEPDEFYAKFYDITTGKEMADKRITNEREIFIGICMYHGDTQPVNLEQERCENAGCEHICVNEPNKATCLCSEGFTLETDGKSCKETGNLKSLVISTGGSLCLLDIRVLSDQSDFKPEFFYTGSDIITDFDIDMNARHVYFATGSTVYRVYIDKDSNGQWRGREQIWQGDFTVSGMSYDYVRRRLYFGVDSDPPQLWYIDVNTDSPVPTNVNIIDGDMRSLLVLPSENKAYWLAGLNVLQSVDLADTANPEVIDLAIVYHPRGWEVFPKHLVHDNKFEEFFILIDDEDGVHSDLLVVDYNGTGSYYLSADDDVADFAIYREYLVLVSNKDGKNILQSADLGLGTPLQIVDEGTISGLDEIYAVKILDAILQEEVQNPCGPSSNNGGCEHICIPGDQTATCQCKLGFTLDTDGKQCDSTPVYDEFILVTDSTYGEIFMIPLNDPTTAIGIRIPTTDRPDGVIYNYLTGDVFWTGSWASKIWAIHPNGTRYRVVSDVYDTWKRYPDQLAVDPSTGNIYYTAVSYDSDDLYNSGIAVIGSHGDETVVVFNGHKLRDIEIDPAEGVMFWTDYSEFYPVIFRANMDGSAIVDLHTDNVTWPNGIAVDPLAKRIYWTDSHSDSIYYSDYDGGNRNVFMKVEKGLRPMDLELVGDYLYYTAMGSQQVTGVNKNNKGDIKQFGPQSGLGRLYALDVYSSTAPTNTPVNRECATNNGGCSHFCFPKAGGHSCGCSLLAELLLDGKTCSNAPLCPMTVPNGLIREDSTCVGAEGNMCAFTCMRGYKPRATVEKITCILSLFQLNWDVQDPCEMVTCPSYIENGVVIARGNCSLQSDDVCEYSCNDGLEVNKDMRLITCSPSGEWDTKNTTLCTEKKKSNKVAIGVGVGVGVLVLIVISILLVCLIRTGKIPCGKKEETNVGGSSFENPRYAGTDMQLSPTEANTSFGYTTLQEDKMAASATNTTYDNIQPRI